LIFRQDKLNIGIIKQLNRDDIYDNLQKHLTL